MLDELERLKEGFALTLEVLELKAVIHPDVATAQSTFHMFISQ